MKRFLFILNLLVLGLLSIELLPFNYGCGVLLALLIWFGWKMT